MSDLVPQGRLEAYLRGRIPGFQTLSRITKTATGQSNPTFVLDTDIGPLVLRRKPPGTLLKSAHAIDREYRVMEALAESAVPVPKMHHYCADEDVIGAAFFIMEHVSGVTANDPACPGMDISARRALYDRMNATLASLHRLDAVALGLERFGRPDAYFPRQLARWTAQYRESQTGTDRLMDDLIAWLEDHVPAEDGLSALVHGDWRLDNLLFDPASGRITAVLDWELSTRGHPHADLAAQIMQWQMPAGPSGRGLEGVDRAALGIPEDADYIATYAARVGLDAPPDLTFPLAFAFFRMAAILQGVRFRALTGNASNPEAAAALTAQIPTLIRKAHEGISAAG